MEDYKIGKRVYKQVIVDGKKIEKEVFLYGVTEYNKDEQEIHYIFYDPFGVVEVWYEYDENGNKIREHTSHHDGYEEWQEFDSKGYLVSEKNTRGKNLRFNNKYNSNGKIAFIDEISSGRRTWKYEYDENGRKIYQKFMRPVPKREVEFFYEYNDQYGDQPILEKKIVNGTLDWETKYEYDENGRKIYKKSMFSVDKREVEVFYEYSDQYGGQTVNMMKTENLQRSSSAVCKINFHHTKA